jgi:uncharacterized protein YbaP (TraB family)
MGSSSYYRDMKTRLAPLFLAAATSFALSAMPARAELAKPFLWELSKGDKTVTLFGSLHVGKPDFYPIPEPVQKRFDDAKVLAVEADVTVPETQQACSKMAATSEKLETILSADDYAALLGYVRAAGIPDTAIEGRKLWLVNLVLVGIELGQLGVDFSSGLDVAFLRDAKRLKKQVVEVEGGQKQCAALAGATTAETAAAMTRFLASVRQNRMERRLAEMVDAYRTGNGPSLIRVVNEEFGDSAEGIAARRRVFDDRHPAMAEVIDGYFKQADRHFVVIGVGHMFGDNSLLDALAKRGIRAKRIE